MDVAQELPGEFFEVTYVGAMIPGAAHEEEGLRSGANCQRFAYAVLAHFALAVPPLRSSELWQDRVATVAVASPEPLDLALFGRGEDPWGAHVGVYLGDDEIMHLCKEVRLPAIWPLADFRARDRYRNLIGYKRVRPL